MNNSLFFFARLPMAISLVGHGAVRLPKLQGFSEWMVTTMEKSFLPIGLVQAWGYVLPIIELLLGIWLLIGIQLRYCLYASLTLMAILVLGSSSIENWSAIEAQLVHGMYLFGLLWYYEAKTKDREGN